MKTFINANIQWFLMILKETLRKIVQLQKKELESDIGIRREILDNIDLKTPHIIILSGIRRCSKSTLLKQIMKKIGKSYYFNFEDQRLIRFDVSDFEKLSQVLKEEFGECKSYFLDEIQNITHWERFVRAMQDTGKKFIITGSNASLLSRELGSKLTGRHLTYELFPFSYKEMLKLTKQEPSLSSFENYLKNGGFPEYLKYNKTEMLQELFKDIITRDIIVRHGLRESQIMKEIALYLISNTGKEFSYNKLKKYFNLGSVNTIISYISYLEDSYVIFTLSRFDYSYKKQIISPKKVYSIDTGFSTANSVSFSADKGRVFENMVFLNLRKKYKDIFYFKEEKECDFLIKEKGKITQAIQVCYELTEENKEREIDGLKEAMKKLKLQQGLIITLNQKEEVDNIKIVPAWKFLLEF